jgi:outer membrane receptor protein involved in Fe transport
LALVHQLSEGQSLKFLYGEAFRAPTTNEMKLRDLFGLVGLIGNPDLEPENIKTLELVWLVNSTQQAFGLTLFNQHIESAIVRDNSVAPNTFSNQRGDEYSQGLELEYTINLLSHWRLTNQFSVVNNIASSDFQQAETLASLILNYSNKPWNVNIASHYAGEREFLALGTPQTLDAYWQINGKMQFAIDQKQSLYLQIKNLLDEDYATPVGRSDIAIPVPNRGREVALGYRWDF